MGERLVRLGHLVRVFPLLHRVPAVGGGVHDLARELLPYSPFGFSFLAIPLLDWFQLWIPC